MSKTIKVINRYGGAVAVRTSTGKRILFNTLGVEKHLTEDEIFDIYNQAGGRQIFLNRLIITDEEMTEKLGIETEPEYFFTIEDAEALLREGTVEQLREALEYNTEGFAEMIKEIALRLEISDMSKLGIVSMFTRTDMIKTMENYKDMKSIDNTPVKAQSGRRNVFTPGGKVEKAVAPVEAPAPAREAFKKSEDFVPNIVVEQPAEEVEKPAPAKKTTTKKTTTKTVAKK